MDTAQLYARRQMLSIQRKRLGIDVEKMAKLCGVTKPEYEAYEEGRTEWHPDIDFDELMYYFTKQAQHYCVEGDPRIRQDRFEK